MKAGSCKKPAKVKVAQMKATKDRANAVSNRAITARKKVYK